MTLPELVELNRRGLVDSDTIICAEGTAEWLRFGTLMAAEETIVERQELVTTGKRFMNHQYKVTILTTGCFTRTLDPMKLQQVLNQEAKGGWRFAKSIHEEKKVLGIFSREAHFLIFEKCE